jgi:chaperonin cofactor prefoldin
VTLQQDIDNLRTELQALTVRAAEIAQGLESVEQRLGELEEMLRQRNNVARL